jgi:site-specific DNA-methyltransferase (adenine-specific)
MAAGQPLRLRRFKDFWEWNEEAARLYEEVIEHGGRVADAMRAFRTLLGGSDVLTYLAIVAPRFIKLRRVLKPTGSIYLHCDPTASHYKAPDGPGIRSATLSLRDHLEAEQRSQ